MKDSLKLLVIGDSHYTGNTDIQNPFVDRQIQYGLEFLKRALRRVADEDKPDVIVLLGDLVNDGLEDTAANDLSDIRKAVESTGIETIFVPGNHDVDYSLFFTLTGGSAGPLFVKNFILYAFADAYGENDFCARKEEDLNTFRSVVKKHPEKKIIVLQHNPVYPAIENAYPYNLANAESVHKCYAENRVMLSLSGHYHPGQELTHRDGVGYLTVPALCTEPFSYTVIEAQEDGIKTRACSLKNPVRLADNHCHTQFAYCAEDITIDAVLERASMLGMSYVCFTEHAGQLYLTKEEYWGHKFFHNPGLMPEARKNGTDRMAAFRQAVADSGSSLAKIGLEIESDAYAGITLLPEDRAGLNIVIGAVHVLPEELFSAPSEKLHSAFMKTSESLMRHGIAVLAHPFRFFCRGKIPAPQYLYRPMAKMLKGYGVAAELNFHTNRPDPEFFAACIEEGVKISLGTDTHNILEAGDFHQHLALLKTIGVSEDMLGSMLYILP